MLLTKNVHLFMQKIYCYKNLALSKLVKIFCMKNTAYQNCSVFLFQKHSCLFQMQVISIDQNNTTAFPL